jgi:subtilisin-like proprotein convertase family protein
MGRFQRSCLAAAFFLAAAAVINGQDDSGLFIAVTVPETASAADASTLRRRFVTIATEPMALRPAAQLVLNLFPDVRLTAERVRIEPIASGFVWVGTIPESADSRVTIAVVNGIASASIVISDAAYSVRTAGNNSYEIRQITRMPPLPHGVPRTPAAASATSESERALADDGWTVDALVVYTSAARAAQPGSDVNKDRDAIEALIQLGISETNQAFASSGVADNGNVLKIRLVHLTEVIMNESGNAEIELNRLIEKSDGHHDWIHGLRDTYGADLVHLVVNTLDVCGKASLMKTASTTFADQAFSISSHICFDDYVLAHEWGHNMGLQHDAFASNGATGVFPFSRGYVNQAAFAPGATPSQRWRDIMAYEDQCFAAGFACPSIPRFSNPSLTYNGDRLGDENAADGARSLRATRVTVANFRPSAPEVSVNDVSVTEGHGGTKNASFTVSLSRASTTTTSVSFATTEGTASNRVTLLNPAPIEIPVSSSATPYPSTIVVPNGLGTLKKLSVRLIGVTHNFRYDLDILLVGPSGQSVMLVSDAGGASDFAGSVDWTIDDAGAPFTYQFAPSGTYRPTNLDGSTSLSLDHDIFPAPAPSGSPGAALSVFDESDPAGEWRLFVNDDFPADGGRLAGGWALVMTTTLGGDYIVTSGILTLPAGSTAGTVVVPIRSDTAFEPPEQFLLKLSAPVGLVIADDIGVATIRNDDFTDDPVVAGGAIKAVHIEELRSQINGVRALRGLVPAAFGPARVPRVSFVNAADIVNLRVALAEACPGLSFSDPTITPRVTTVKAAHVMELRAAALACQP